MIKIPVFVGVTIVGGVQSGIEKTMLVTSAGISF
jgi:hypothetical protein